jgi:hypothetical protein
MAVDFSRIVPVDHMKGDDEEDTALLKQMLEEASRYLCSFDWCSRVVRAWFGLGVGGVVAVFLFEIGPVSSDVDPLLWVIVGDLPPAYLVTDSLATPSDALRTYVEEMRTWVETVKGGGSLEDVIPVDTPATPEFAERLATRLDYFEREFLASPP